MGSRKTRSVLAGAIAVAVLAGGPASAFASGPSAPLACSAAQLGMLSMAQLNVAATQGCVLPVLDPVAQAPAVEGPSGPVAAGVPQRAAGVPRGLILAGALATGLTVALLASNGSNGRLPISR